MNSKIALKIYSLKRSGVIKTNAQFWREFSKEKLENYYVNTIEDEKYLNNINVGIICCFDDDFPVLPQNLSPSERPFLFAYMGDLGLINNLSKNIAIVGLVNPTNQIIVREQKIIYYLKNSSLNIVSGLAIGCDTIAHQKAIDCDLKTIAVLPSTIEEIYPPKNINLAKQIIQKGGLIITEYITSAKNRYENISRFVARDRLQAMFSKAIILIASNKEHCGDSGSRHALNKAKKYGIKTFIMYNPKTDSENTQLALNKQYYEAGTPLLNKKALENLQND